MTKIFCRGCERVLDDSPGESEAEIKAQAAILYARLGGKCPACGRELWKEAKKLPAPVAIPLRFFT